MSTSNLFDSSLVRSRIRTLVGEDSCSLKHLAVCLGYSGDIPDRMLVCAAKQFLCSETTNITSCQLIRIARRFHRPLHYFVAPEETKTAPITIHQYGSGHKAIIQTGENNGTKLATDGAFIRMEEVAHQAGLQ